MKINSSRSLDWQFGNFLEIFTDYFVILFAKDITLNSNFESNIWVTFAQSLTEKTYHLFKF